MPLSADAGGSLGIKPHRDDNAAAHGGVTARCALAYTSGSNEPLRRWPFEIIQDLTGNSAIRSADPENPTLEPNMKCIGSPVAEIWPFAYLGSTWNLHFGGEGEAVGDRRWHHSKQYCDHCDRCATRLCNHSAAICDRMSPTLKSTGGTLGQNFPVFSLE